MPAADNGILTEEEAHELLTFYSGMRCAYDQLNELLFKIDPEASSPEVEVISNYLDAWWSEMVYKVAQIEDYIQEVKRNNSQKLLQNFGAPDISAEDLEWSPEFVKSLNENCREAIRKTMESYSEETGDV